MTVDRDSAVTNDASTLEQDRIHGLAKSTLQFHRLVIACCAIGLLVINFASGLLAHQLQKRVTSSALGIYDNTFTSTNYIHQAEIGFQQYAIDRRHAVDQGDIDMANEQLGAVLDDLGIAIDSAGSKTLRSKGLEARAQIALLVGADYGGERLETRLESAQNALDNMAKSTAAVGLRARDEIEAIGSSAGFWLLGSVFISVALAGGTLFLLRQMIAQRTISQMAYMANYDHLTAIPNRSQFRTRLSDAIKEQGQTGVGFAVLSLDLDRFKSVNDTLGHPTGDRLLIEVASRIKGVLRKTDVVARFGGDEFVILQSPVLKAAEASKLAERLIAVVSEPYVIDDQQILVGASVGVAFAPQDGHSIEDLLRNSDVALYRAKTDGKGRHRFFTAEMNVFMQLRRQLELDLREATDKRQLEVYFQPLLEISTGRVTACEALVRWTHPTRGRVSPADFIPLAEENGLIVEIGEQVLRVACAEAASWNNDMRIAVNLSAVQFQSGNLVETVSEVLRETGLEPTRLELEITESILIGEKNLVMQTLIALRDLGVRIALDDFGTGYSSLSYLTSFPFDKIKIDRSFVQNIAERPDAAAIVRAILSLASTLHLSTTAEGVEKTEELDWLRSYGCDQAQGFLFSPAVPSGDLKYLLGMKVDTAIDNAAAAAA